MPIQINHLRYVYNEGTTFEKVALDDINIEVKDGELVGLIGHTGSGKSTLIQHLNALLSPTSGEIIIDDENIHDDKKRLKFIRQKVGLVFQYPEHQLFEMTVFKDVSYGPLNMGISKEDIDKRAKVALCTVGLDESVYEKSPFELSGGQKRRVAIAGVLAMQPKYLILDEPTAGLDPQGRDEILMAIKSMQKSLGITVILVSHSMEDVARMVDRIIVMHEGKLKMDNKPDIIFSKIRELEEIGLAAPQITYALNKLRDKGLDLPPTIFTTEDATKALFKLLRQVEK